MTGNESKFPVVQTRGPNRPYIRRGPRRQEIIALPPLPPPPKPPTSSRHAKLFALSLLGLVLLGTLLLATPWTTESGDATPPVDALFIAVSAATVTGLVTVDTQDHWNFLGESIVLLLIQVGGLGFMVGASLVLQALRGSQVRLKDVMLLQLGEPTASLTEAERLAGRIVRFVLGVEAVGAIVLTLAYWRTMPLPEAAWHGIFHAVSAFCNAGFDLQGEFRSLTGFDTAPVVNGTVMLLIQAGALSYIVFADVSVRRRWSHLSLDTKLVITGNAVLLGVGTAVFMATEWNRTLSDTPLAARPMVSLFQSVASRTAGFATVNFADVHTVVLFAWVGLMFVGGASGSTAGGVKISTVMVIVAGFVSSLRGSVEPEAFGRRLPVPVMFRALTVIVLMLIIHFTATMALAASGDFFGHTDHSFIAIMFEAMSALATVGLSTGITPELDALSKLILCITMFVGRLGPLTAVYALQRRQQKLRYRLPQAPIRLG